MKSSEARTSVSYRHCSYPGAVISLSPNRTPCSGRSLSNEEANCFPPNFTVYRQRRDQLQLRAKFAEDEQDTEAGERVPGGDFDMSDDEDWQGSGSNASRSLVLVQSALEASSNLVDEYVQEAMSANGESGYFDTQTLSSPPSDPHFAFDEHDHV
jgi:hypothetical protein